MALEEAQSGVDEWEERKVGRDPRKAVTQRDRLGETSKSLEAKEASWTRSAWALGRGGRRDKRAEVKLEEEDKALLLMNSLPKSFEHSRMQSFMAKIKTLPYKKSRTQ